MGFQVLVDGETYSHVDAWGPIEIVDSFVARSNKLTSTSGNGEAKCKLDGAVVVQTSPFRLRFSF